MIEILIHIYIFIGLLTMLMFCAIIHSASKKELDNIKSNGVNWVTWRVIYGSFCWPIFWYQGIKFIFNK